jgi:hypothetical protein
VASPARLLAGTSFNGDADYFVDFAFPVPMLVNEGVIASAADLSDSFFFPATSTNPEQLQQGLPELLVPPVDAARDHQGRRPSDVAAGLLDHLRPGSSWTSPT